MDEFIGIKYKLKSSENFDEYLKQINVGWMLRKVATSSRPVCWVSREGARWSLTLAAPVRSITIDFTPGEEFHEDRADGLTVKSIVTIDGSKLVQRQQEPGGRASLHVRHFTPDTLTVTTTVEGWDGKCVRVYERIP